MKNIKKLKILIDSGSSLTLVSENFISNNDILANCKKTAVNPVKFTVGNGGTLLSTEKICFEIYVQNVKIRLNAYVVKSLIGVELILGNDVLSDLGGILYLEARAVRLKDKRIILSPVRKYVIYPGQSCHVALKGKFPQLVKNSECVISTTGKLKKLTATNLLVRAKSSTITIPVINKTNRAIILDGFKSVAFANTAGMIAIARKIPDTVHHSMNISSTNFPSHLTEVERHNLEEYPHLHPQDP